MLSSTASDPFCSDKPRTKKEDLKNVRIAIRALEVAALFKGGLAGCAVEPDSNGHVTITGTTIAGYAFYACNRLISVTISDTVTSISFSAFERTALTSVTIPDSVLSIDGYSFYAATALNSVTIGDSVTYIGDYAFYDATALNSVCASSTVAALYGGWAEGVTIDPSCGSSVTAAAGDPHLSLAYGGKADFRGTPGAYFNLLSALGLSLNVLFVGAMFKLRELTVDGSFMTEAHLALGTLSGKRLLVTYDAGRLGPSQAAHDMVTATCGDEATVVIGPKAVVECDEVRASIDASTLTVATGEWLVKVTGQPVYGRLSGPAHRLDVALEPLVAEEKFAAKPHGLVGQSYDGSKVPRYGRVDQYPPLEVPADFTTAAMAEGAIEGVAADYQVADKYATQFKFSRFAA